MDIILDGEVWHVSAFANDAEHPGEVVDLDTVSPERKAKAGRLLGKKFIEAVDPELEVDIDYPISKPVKKKKAK